MQLVIVIIAEKIIDENVQYDTNRKATEILALSSGKINKYENHTCVTIYLLIEINKWSKEDLLILYLEKYFKKK